MKNRPTHFVVLNSVFGGLAVISTFISFIRYASSHYYFQGFFLVNLLILLFFTGSIVFAAIVVYDRRVQFLLTGVALVAFGEVFSGLVFEYGGLYNYPFNLAPQLACGIIVLLVALKCKKDYDLEKVATQKELENAAPTSQEALEKMQKLKQLADLGIITQEVFEEKRADLVQYL